jgi:hypothetical protein
LEVPACLIVAAGVAPAVVRAGDIQRRLYAVNKAAADRGTISVYNIDNGKNLLPRRDSGSILCNMATSPSCRSRS